MEEAKRKAHVQAVKRYNQKMVQEYKLRLNKKTDADLIEILDAVDNKQGYIKKALRFFASWRF